MDLYTLNNLWERTAVVDRFTSLIWTERWAGYGEFELTLPATPENRALFAINTPLAIDKSYRVMLVEQVEGKYSDDDVLTVKGRSLEAFLMNRVARNSGQSLTASPKWVYSNTPQAVGEYMLNTAFINTADALPRLFLGQGPVPADTITAIETNTVTWEQPPTDMYEAMVTLCSQYELGFRMLRDPGANQVFVKVYTGVDRTNQQRVTTFPNIIFSRDLDNFVDVTELTSNVAHKTHAQVMSPQGYVEVYANGGVVDSYGLAKRTMPVIADAVPGVSSPSAAQVTQYLTRVGQTALGQQRLLRYFDGQAAQMNGYVYQTDYWLGDIVEIRSVDGERGYRRVSEQIFVSDEEGERNYPTLAATIVRT